MSRSKSHGNLNQAQTESPSQMSEVDPDKSAKSFSSHGSGDPATLQDQVPAERFLPVLSTSSRCPAIKAAGMPHPMCRPVKPVSSLLIYWESSRAGAPLPVSLCLLLFVDGEDAFIAGCWIPFNGVSSGRCRPPGTRSHLHHTTDCARLGPHALCCCWRCYVTHWWRSHCHCV